MRDSGEFNSPLSEISQIKYKHCGISVIKLPV